MNIPQEEVERMEKEAEEIMVRNGLVNAGVLVSDGSPFRSLKYSVLAGMKAEYLHGHERLSQFNESFTNELTIRETKIQQLQSSLAKRDELLERCKEIERLKAENERLTNALVTRDGDLTNKKLMEENQNLKTVMIAAAEEIQEHWKAHCDEEGYGPANLMRRLEKGIPAQYGYTAGAFTKDKELIQEIWSLWESMAECGQLSIGPQFSANYERLKKQISKPYPTLNNK